MQTGSRTTILAAVRSILRAFAPLNLHVTKDVACPDNLKMRLDEFRLSSLNSGRIELFANVDQTQPREAARLHLRGIKRAANSIECRTWCLNEFCNVDLHNTS